MLFGSSIGSAKFLCVWGLPVLLIADPVVRVWEARSMSEPSSEVNGRNLTIDARKWDRECRVGLRAREKSLNLIKCTIVETKALTGEGASLSSSYRNNNVKTSANRRPETRWIETLDNFNRYNDQSLCLSVTHGARRISRLEPLELVDGNWKAIVVKVFLPGFAFTVVTSHEN